MQRSYHASFIWVMCTSSTTISAWKIFRERNFFAAEKQPKRQKKAHISAEHRHGCVFYATKQHVTTQITCDQKIKGKWEYDRPAGRQTKWKTEIISHFRDHAVVSCASCASHGQKLAKRENDICIYVYQFHSYPKTAGDRFVCCSCTNAIRVPPARK